MTSVVQIHELAASQQHQLAEDLMDKLISPRKSILVLAGLLAYGYMHVPVLSAQDKTPPQQINLQFSGFIPGTSTGNVTTDFPTDSTGTPITYQPTTTGGLNAKYAYQFNKWAGADAGFGMARYSQNYAGDFGTSSVESNLRQLTTDFVLHIPDRLARIHPYAVIGVGAMRFNPTENVNNMAGTVAQTRAAFIYGGGADIDVSKRVGIRAEYRGFRFKVPDFQLPALTMNEETHIAEPSVGVYFRFSTVSIGKKEHTGN
jgi:opacity protein-like surface antigen